MPNNVDSAEGNHVCILFNTDGKAIGNGLSNLKSFLAEQKEYQNISVDIHCIGLSKDLYCS